jgi:hypothetical protein
MDKVRFGKTGLMASKIAFGAIPIQRLPFENAVNVVRGAIGLGVNFIDTANGYSDSEEKIGAAIKGMPRDALIIASKSRALDKQGFIDHIDLSLKRLGTDYIDIYQLHGVSTPEQESAVFGGGGAYEGLLEAIRAGKVRHAGFTSHSVRLAVEIMRKGYGFASVQLPFNFVDTEALDAAIPLARELGMGFIAMKPLGGGLLSDAGLAFRYLAQFDGIVPDPGIEGLHEIEEIVQIANANKPFTADDAAAVERTKAELGSIWCHRCEYCRPCPQNIGISLALCLDSFLKRMPLPGVVGMVGQTMEAAKHCTGCRACVARCPYNLDIPGLIQEKLKLWDGVNR